MLIYVYISCDTFASLTRSEPKALSEDKYVEWS